MLHWTLLGELYSFMILTVLFVRYVLYERKSSARTNRQKMFIRCLTMSMLMIGLNSLSVYILDNPGIVPRWLNILINSVYFEWALCVSSEYAYLIFNTILEHVYDKHCLRRAKIALGSILGASVALIIVNLFTGAVFSISETGEYSRGPLNRYYYLLLLAQVFFVGVCYFRNRGSASNKVVYVMRTAPGLVVLLCVLQFAYPDILLNGTIAAMVALVIFLAFRSHTEEHDSLTGVGSRKALMDELALRTDSGQAVQIILISLTNLADINLLYGHTVGDALIYETSNYLRGVDRQVRVFRSNGIVFTLLLPLDEARAEKKLQDILSRLQEPWQIGDVSCQMNFAVAEYRSASLAGSATEIMEQLEYTLTNAKMNPPLARYDAGVTMQLSRRMHLTELIRHAIDEGKFRVVYQPIYCCHRDVFCSAEALLRLNDVDGTPIPPDVFIPVAEESGLSVELTWVVLENICQLLSREDMNKLQFVSMNLSTRQLMEPRLAQKIRARLDEYGIPANRLKVEITEQVLKHNVKFAKEQQEALAAAAIELIMDDFGTGYSNLSSVMPFPFAYVKLDRSLIAPVEGDERAAVTVRALLGLFRSLDKRIIMEGVETQEQIDCLRAAGVDMIQGYYYAKPTTGDRIKAYF